MQLFALDDAVTFELALPRPAPQLPPDITVEEVARDALRATLDGSPLPPLDLAAIDAVSPGPWRCFVACERGRPIHHTFVARADAAPLLFRVFTAPAQRRRGRFALVVRVIAARLAAEGHTRLRSSSSRLNLPSLRAHRAAGFVVIRRRLAPVVLGVDLLALLGGLRRALRRRG